MTRFNFMKLFSIFATLAPGSAVAELFLVMHEHMALDHTITHDLK